MMNIIARSFFFIALILMGSIKSQQTLEKRAEIEETAVSENKTIYTKKN